MNDQQGNDQGGCATLNNDALRLKADSWNVPKALIVALLSLTSTLLQINSASFAADPKHSNPGDLPPFPASGNPLMDVGDKLFGVPKGCNGPVTSMAEGNDGSIYLGGYFTVCEETQASRIAVYNPNTRSFSSIGAGSANGVDGPVHSILVHQGGIYIGGNFTKAGGQPAGGVAFWNGVAWNSMLGGVDGAVYALESIGPDVFVGGAFARAGNRQLNSVAKWTGSLWLPLDDGRFNGVSGAVFALKANSRDLFVGGSFSHTQFTPTFFSRQGIARWNGSTWNSLGPEGALGVTGEVHSLALANEKLYLGGTFNRAGNVSASGVAAWDSRSGFSALGTATNNGVSGTVYALTTAGSEIIVAGEFGLAAGLPVGNLARWNGQAWSRIKTTNDANEAVLSLLNVNESLYVGGRFSLLETTPVSYIGAFVGSEWIALGRNRGLGVNGSVNDLLVLDGQLYVTGDFAAAGGQQVNNIARWNGSVWQGLGLGAQIGLNDTGLVLAQWGRDLIVGGLFTMAGGVQANRVALWNGQQWNSIGTGTRNGVPGDGTVVNALAVFRDDLYVGGRFTRAGETIASHIARWNGSNWSSLSSGITGVSVSSLASDSNYVYVGGFFDSAGTRGAPNIARWNGSEWFSMGIGLTALVGGQAARPSVLALETDGTMLYAGGSFTHTGIQPLTHIAQCTA